MALEKKVLEVMAWNTCKTKAFVQFFLEHFQVEKYIIKTQRCCHVHLSAFDTVKETEDHHSHKQWVSRIIKCKDWKRCMIHLSKNLFSQ